MNLLVTLIGNAAVDPIFRRKFLEAPLATADAYGFILTKGEVELLEKVFTKEMKEAFERDFEKLEQRLYQNLATRCKRPPCAWSLYPPAAYRADYLPTKEEEKAAA